MRTKLNWTDDSEFHSKSMEGYVCIKRQNRTLSGLTWYAFHQSSTTILARRRTKSQAKLACEKHATEIRQKWLNAMPVPTSTPTTVTTGEGPNSSETPSATTTPSSNY